MQRVTTHAFHSAKKAVKSAKISAALFCLQKTTRRVIKAIWAISCAILIFASKAARGRAKTNARKMQNARFTVVSSFLIVFSQCMEYVVVKNFQALCKKNEKNSGKEHDLILPPLGVNFLSTPKALLTAPKKLLFYRYFISPYVPRRRKTYG